MLSLQECLDFSGLGNEEVATISQAANVPDIVAAEMASELLQTPRGVYRLHCMFREALERAWESGHALKAKRIERAYADFCRSHPMPRVL
jgi:hypothetical protein